LSSPPDSAGGVDFFAHGGLPVPLVSAAEAAGLAASSFGMKVSAFPLGSQQDCNFLLRGDGGQPAGVLKIANPAFSRTEIEAQDAAAELVAAAGLRAGVATHGPVVVTAGGGPAIARVLRYLPGGTLTGGGYLAPPVVAELGAVAGRVSRALDGFDHPGLERSGTCGTPTGWSGCWRSTCGMRVFGLA
jgi:Ser/Thr protein kinase RdoA (MazF antagonist)